MTEALRRFGPWSVTISLESSALNLSGALNRNDERERCTRNSGLSSFQMIAKSEIWILATVSCAAPHASLRCERPLRASFASLLCQPPIWRNFCVCSDPVAASLCVWGSDRGQQRKPAKRDEFKLLHLNFLKITKRKSSYALRWFLQI